MEEIDKLMAEALQSAFESGRASQRLIDAQNEFNQIFMASQVNVAALMQAISPPDKKDVN